MKTAFVSDIHGNYEALRAVLARIDQIGVDAVVCAGDTVGYYTQINECCDELQRRGIPSVMGNHDWYMATGSDCPRSRSVNACLRYQRGVITASNLAWVRGLASEMNVDGARLVHGGWGDPIDEYLEPSQEYFERLEGEVFVSGHTHIQTLRRYGCKTYCNPGSVGQPRDDDPRAAFAIYDGYVFALHRVEYDMKPVFDLMAAAGFNDYYYGSLRTGARNLCHLPAKGDKAE